MNVIKQGATKRRQQSHWGTQFPCDVLATVFELLDLQSRVAAAAVCKAWRTTAQRPSLWPAVQFRTRREGSRRSELRRLASLAAWAQRHASGTQALAISARVPSDCQQAAIKLASQAALAAAASLQSLSLQSNRGFWAGGWLPRLHNLRSLELCSREGALSLHGDLRSLSHLTRLVLEAAHGVSVSEQARLPPGVLSVELSCIRDTLPQQLSQLTGLQRLAVRRGEVSEGVLLIEYDCLSSLRVLTWLALEQQAEEEAWLPPLELFSIGGLRHLSIAGNNCSRWALHGSYAVFDLMLTGMPALTSLDLSNCGLEALPRSLLLDVQPAEDRDGAPVAADAEAAAGAGGVLGDGGGGGGAGGAGHWMVAAHRPGLMRLMAGGNQLEAGNPEGAGDDDNDQQFAFPGSVQQLCIDWQVLQQAMPPGASTPPTAKLPHGCHTLAVLGRDGVMHSLLGALPDLLAPAVLPHLRHLMLEPEALDALQHPLPHPHRQASSGGSGSGCWVAGFHIVGGRWRPTRLPGQPRAPQHERDVLRELRAAGVQVHELQNPRHLTALLDELDDSVGQGQH